MQLIKELIKLKRSKLLILLPAGIICLLLAKYIPFMAEYFFARFIYKIFSLPLGLLTGWLPFSLAEIIIVSIPFVIVVLFIIFLIKMIKGKKDRRLIAGKAILNVLVFVSLMFFGFVILCGTNYYRYDFETFCDFTVGEYTEEELKELCLYLAEKANETKGMITQVNENGEVQFDYDFDEISQKASEAMSMLAEKYPVLKYSTGSAKEVIFSRYMSYGGIVGIFIPYTMEASVNTDVNDYNRPADTCHELAHMRGFMKEDEANYIAYLACIGYDEPEFQYSGYMMALIRSTNALYGQDPKAYYEVMDNLSDSVIIDILQENEYWDELRNSSAVAEKVDEVVTNVNDTYLKVNGQENGVKSYGMMVDLLLADFLSDSKNEK